MNRWTNPLKRLFNKLPKWEIEIEAPFDWEPDAVPVAEREVVPGKLTVRVYSHQLETPAGPVDCWSYFSEGLMHLGQAEILFTVAKQPGEGDGDYLLQVFELYEAIYKQAEDGRIVGLGAMTRLDPRTSGLFGRDDFRGVLYGVPQLFRGVHVKGQFLTGIVLTEDEVQVAMQCGTVRVLNLLGEKYRFFPSAPWMDRNRSSVAKLDDMKDSALMQVDKVQLQDVFVFSSQKMVKDEAPESESEASYRFEDIRLMLLIPRQVREALVEILNRTIGTAPVAFMSVPDPQADMAMVWFKGQPFTLAGPGSPRSHLAANFLCFAPGEPEDEIHMCEDGFLVSVTVETWRNLKQAMIAGENAGMQSKEAERRLEIVWAG